MTFDWRSPGIRGVFDSFSSFVQLIFVCISVPIWPKLSFLNVTTSDGRYIQYGAWGYTGAKSSVGFSFDPVVLGFSNTLTTSATLHGLTFAMILHPIAALFSFLAVVAGFFGLCAPTKPLRRRGWVYMTVLSAINIIITLTVFIIDMSLWGLARKYAQEGGATAGYGWANWMVLGCPISAVISTLAGLCVSTKRFEKFGKSAFCRIGPRVKEEEEEEAKEEREDTDLVDGGARD